MELSRSEYESPLTTQHLRDGGLEIKPIDLKLGELGLKSSSEISDLALKTRK
jgi:hypothetical protein